MNTAVINVALGQGYERGQIRLNASLVRHYPFRPMLWQKWPAWEYSKATPYAAKAAALSAAMAAGHTHILWLDASVIVSGPLDPIFARMDTDGVYLPTSGYNCAQTCNDRILEYFQVTRDQAEHIPDAATGCFGVNVEHEAGAAFARMFIQAAKDGQFEGSRMHDGQSHDPRFLFHRQDQSAAGLIAHHLGIKTQPMGTLVGYYPAQTVVQFKSLPQ